MLGPGSLPTDAIMLGLDHAETRPLLKQALDVIVRLLSDEVVSASTNDRWDLTDARLHLRPYTTRCSSRRAAVASPAGPRLAGRYGLGLLSIGATQRRASTCWDCTGTSWRSGRRITASPSIGRSGDSSG